MHYADHINAYYMHVARMKVYQPFPFDEFARIVGGHNWVIARRSPRIVEKFGIDVICLTAKQYNNASRLARANAYSKE